MLALLVACALLATGCGDDGGPETTEPQRAEADVAAADELGIALRLDADADFGGPAPRLADALAPSLAERSCIVISPAPGGEPRVLELPPGGAVVEAAQRDPAELRLRRLARESFPVGLGQVPAGGRGVVRIPRDDVDTPWQLAVRSRAMMSVCGPG